MVNRCDGYEHPAGGSLKRYMLAAAIRKDNCNPLQEVAHVGGQHASLPAAIAEPLRG